MSVRGKSKVHNEMGFALMAVNIRKYTAINTENGTFSPEDGKNACAYLFMINTSIFIYPRLVLSQPLALRLKAFITGLSLKGSLNGLPYAPHPRTDSLRISYSYLFLFRCPVNGSYSSNNVS